MTDPEKILSYGSLGSGEFGDTATTNAAGEAIAQAKQRILEEERRETNLAQLYTNRDPSVPIVIDRLRPQE